MKKQNIDIRPENEGDYAAIKVVNDLAFRQENESRLVKALRDTTDFVSRLSLVAEYEQKIVGHILFYPVRINGENITHIALALAPMSVHPDYQRKGIGIKLVEEGLKRAKELSYSLVIVLGHPEYYPKFGFERASKFGIKTLFDVPDNAFMVLELTDGALKGVKGVIEYPKPFSEV